jgi:hypothetical protein
VWAQTVERKAEDGNIRRVDFAFLGSGSNVENAR